MKRLKPKKLTTSCSAIEAVLVDSRSEIESLPSGIVRALTLRGEMGT
jgi:hypothetical protein